MKLEIGFSKLHDGSVVKHKKCVSMATLIHYPINRMLAMKNEQIKTEHGSTKAQVSNVGGCIMNNNDLPSQNGDRSGESGDVNLNQIYRSSFKFWPKRTKYVCFVEHFKGLPDFVAAGKRIVDKDEIKGLPDFVDAGKRIVEEDEILVDLNNNNNVVESANCSWLFPESFPGSLESDDNEQGSVFQCFVLCFQAPWITCKVPIWKTTIR